MAEGRLAAEGRVIMISGANRGIGRAVAEKLYTEGFALSLGARQVDSLGPLVVDWDPARVLCHDFEARDRGSAAAWVGATADRFGRIDGLVANAGVMHPFDVDEENESLLDEMWEVNVKGPLRLIRAAFPHLRKAGSGRVVNIVSLSGKRVKGRIAGGYAMTKHAAAALTNAVRYSGWEDGIRGTSICPGYVATDMTAEVTSFDRDKMIPAASVAELVSLALTLPNEASVAEIPVNCVLEPLI
ncbi:MAG: SDR family NAD(P)-dependent oxidoreductase [Kiloniellales bacterium]|nr:SDR family NAD(P)-dependent oxidoreductase [Kiloniellales bacterium]